MPVKKSHIEKMVKNAHDIWDNRKTLHDIMVENDYRVSFRPTSTGITVVSLKSKNAQSGESCSSVRSFLKRRKEIVSKVLQKKKKTGREHRLHSFMVRDALSNYGAMECLVKASSESTRPFHTVRYVINEISSPPNNIKMEGKKQRPTCDILAMRRCEGGLIPVLVELKYARKEKELIDQLNDYSKIMWNYTDYFRKLYSCMIPTPVSFTQPLQIERWVVWPNLDSRKRKLFTDGKEEAMLRNGIGIVQYQESGVRKNQYQFHIGKLPQPVTQP